MAGHARLALALGEQVGVIAHLMGDGLDQRPRVMEIRQICQRAEFAERAVRVVRGRRRFDEQAANRAKVREDLLRREGEEG